MKKQEEGTAVPSHHILPNQMTVVQVGEQKVLLTRVQGRVCAVHSRCPHAAADLSQGTLYNGKLECPDHHYVFDVQNGRILWPPDEMLRLKRYEVTEENGQVNIQ